ncbi:MraY family glycosyltransferase [Pseudomonas sp. Marseille-QA0892]
MAFFVWLAVPFALSVLLTWAMRRYAVHRRLMDTPNLRSSHSVPTPRGGGLSIVLVFLLWCVFAFESQPSLLISFLGAGGAVALIGFLDDHGHVPALGRLLVHVLAAAWMLYWIGLNGVAALLGDSAFALAAGAIAATLYLVWLLNLYNFMDGIDGIAGAEGCFVALGGALLFWMADAWQAMWLCASLGAAIAGFLVWNVPPARIFMGDVGSGFVGLVLGGLSCVAAEADPDLFWSWLILLGVFIVDATWTLARRVLRGENPLQAHRSHAYQRRSRAFGSHAVVTIGVTVINLCWLLPMAGLVAAQVLPGPLGLAIAYIPLCLLAWSSGAGLADDAQ